MSVPRSGAISRSAGLFSAVAKQVKLVNLKGVKRVSISFDPFADSAVQTRKFLFYLSAPKIQLTNPSCLIKTEVVCDRSPGRISYDLIPSVVEQIKTSRITFDAENLSALELLQLTNKYVSAHAPKEEVINVVKTKSEKKAVAGKKR